MVLVELSETEKRPALRASDSIGEMNTPLATENKTLVTDNAPADDAIRVVDLFAGIGGFHQAFAKHGGKVVLASEWDKHARATYKHNYVKTDPELFEDEAVTFVGDITKVEPADIPDFDVLCGGFPCQPFSVAGKRLGFEDTRGTLFFNIADILRVKKPAAFFLENVRGLLQHDEGRTFDGIKNTVAELGYSLSWKVVKASDHNLPQHRPRLFLVGFRDDVDSSSFSWPEAVPLTNTISKVLGGEVTTPAGTERTVGFTLRVGGRNSGVHDRRNWDTYIVDGNVHPLTLEQGKALQGFPADFEFPDAVSERQAFKQLGNSVAVPAIAAVAGEVIRVLRSNEI